MNTNEIFSFRATRWFENILAMSFFTALLAVSGIALSVYAEEGSFLANAGLIAAFFCLMIGMLGGIIFAARYEEQNKNAIAARLEQLSTPQLIAMSGSLEINEYCRATVIDFLNKNRAGWSFSIDTVNTTASRA